MQTKHGILLPFIHQHSFLLLQYQISGAKSVSLTYFSNPILQNQGSKLQLILAIFRLILEHWFNTTPSHTFYKENKWGKKNLKYSSQERSALWSAKRITLPLRIWFSTAGTEQHKPCFSLTWQDSTAQVLLSRRCHPNKHPWSIESSHQ